MTSIAERYKVLVALASCVIVVAGLRYAAGFFVPVLLGCVIAAASSPLLTFLLRRRVPPILAALMVLAVDVVALGSVISVILLAASDLQGLLPSYVTRLSSASSSLNAFMNRHGFASSGTSFVHIDQMAGSLASGVADFTSHLVVVLFVVFFGLCEVSVMGDKLRALATNAEAQIERIDRIVREVQLYLLVKTGTSLLAGVCAFFVLTAFGIKLALLLALALFLLHFIPNIGSAIALIPAVLAALADRGPGAAAGVAVCYLTINTLIGNGLEPRLLGRTLGMSPFVVLLVMLFWGWVWGPLGAVLAVPLTVVGKIVVQNIPDLAWIATLVESDPDLSALDSASSGKKGKRRSLVIGLGSHRDEADRKGPHSATRAARRASNND